MSKVMEIHGTVGNKSWTRRIQTSDSPATSSYICVNDIDEYAFSVMYHFNGCGPSISTLPYENACKEIENPKPIHVYYGLT